ncbi:hypothetical protein TNCV_3684561 [Trichonephila clavipes]|uniref:Uncharacterized protein n=1 Tax=Trichonephila clavipes TaxID=2585209 RepID=A0A8X6RMP6_TRICX|nr:hypothetical protein TNCV_3684561 [Trichonephila clavipes]
MRGFAARRLFKVLLCREGPIHLQTMSFPGFKPSPNDTAVSVANHYTGWTTINILQTPRQSFFSTRPERVDECLCCQLLRAQRASKNPSSFLPLNDAMRVVRSSALFRQLTQSLHAQPVDSRLSDQRDEERFFPRHRRVVSQMPSL